MKIEIGKVYNSNFCGDYKVLSKDPKEIVNSQNIRKKTRNSN